MIDLDSAKEIVEKLKDGYGCIVETTRKEAHSSLNGRLHLEEGVEGKVLIAILMPLYYLPNPQNNSYNSYKIILEVEWPPGIIAAYHNNGPYSIDYIRIKGFVPPDQLSLPF